MDDYVIHHGDALTVLNTMPDKSVHSVVTSPAYWGLRDYQTATWVGGDPACGHKPGSMKRVGKTTLGGGTATAGHQHEDYRSICSKCGAIRQDQQLGLEKTPDEYVARLVEVFREVRRVLRDDGTLWLNLGDSYFGDSPTRKSSGETFSKTWDKSQTSSRGGLRRSSARVAGLKPKDLVGIPWRVAFALQADGWWLRSEIIWSKRAPMPESVTDRPTRSHEQIFLLSKSARYFYDAEAVRESTSNYDRKGGTAPYTADGSTTNGIGSYTLHQMNGNGRNQRDTWHLSPEPYPQAHFATFPTEIPRRAIMAGTSERGCCPACGAPWVRIVDSKRVMRHELEKDHPDYRPNRYTVKSSGADDYAKGGAQEFKLSQTTGWRPTCTCPPADPIPCTVLDPFLGSGTTIAVAVGLGRYGVGIELNEKYIELAHKRIGAVQRPLRLVGA